MKPIPADFLCNVSPSDVYLIMSEEVRPILSKTETINEGWNDEVFPMGQVERKHCN